MVPLSHKFHCEMVNLSLSYLPHPYPFFNAWDGVDERWGNRERQPMDTMM